jgi:hypothetical protein
MVIFFSLLMSTTYIFADSGEFLNYFRSKPIDLIQMEYFHQVTKNLSSSIKSYVSSEQAQLRASLEMKQKRINALDNSSLSVLGTRNTRENSAQFTASYSMEKHGILNSLTPTVFIQKQQVDVDTLNGPDLKAYANSATILGSKIEYDFIKGGLTSNGYLVNQRNKAVNYQNLSQSLNELNTTYKILQQNLLGLYSLQCRSSFAKSNSEKLIEAQKKIDLGYKIKMISYSHVLNISEQLNSNEAQRQVINNDLNRVVNYFNSISDNLGIKLLEEVSASFPCEFDKSFVDKIYDQYPTDNLSDKKESYQSSAQFHLNQASFLFADASHKLIRNNIRPDFRPYLQVTKGSNDLYDTRYDDKTVEVGFTMNWGADPMTIRNEILAAHYSKEAAQVKLNYTNKLYQAEIDRIIKSIELRKKLILSAQRALEASDSLIKYNESQKSLGNTDTLTLINGFRTRIQSVTTLVDTLVALEQDYTELVTFSDWKYIERKIKK